MWLQFCVSLGIYLLVLGNSFCEEKIFLDQENTKNVPYEVSIRRKSGFRNETHLCSGAIISRKWVLTAGSCIKHIPAWSSFYVVAEGVEEDLEQRIRVVEIHVHPEYEAVPDSGRNDLALMKLEKPLEFTEFLKPIRLPKTQESQGIKISGKALLSRWGLVDLIDNQECQEILEEFPECYQELDESNLCTLRSENDFRHEDSGGPLVQDGTLIGIVSLGICKNLIIYSRVSSFLDFIKRHENDP